MDITLIVDNVLGESAVWSFLLTHHYVAEYFYEFLEIFSNSRGLCVKIFERIFRKRIYENLLSVCREI